MYDVKIFAQHIIVIKYISDQIDTITKIKTHSEKSNENNYNPIYYLLLISKNFK